MKNSLFNIQNENQNQLLHILLCDELVPDLEPSSCNKIWLCQCDLKVDNKSQAKFVTIEGNPEEENLKMMLMFLTQYYHKDKLANEKFIKDLIPVVVSRYV